MQTPMTVRLDPEEVSVVPATNLPLWDSVEPKAWVWGVQGRLLHSSTFLRPFLIGQPQSAPASITCPPFGRIPANPSVTHRMSQSAVARMSLMTLPLVVSGLLHLVFQVPILIVPCRPLFFIPIGVERTSDRL